ncbi:hypothetical protein [Flavobacterium sp. C4GT6]|uniref:hypothetical protein n=1 Tax=Flavobacterium sp. C4GT6 TaxID=3103818 RepID=UPI002ED5EC46
MEDLINEKDFIKAPEPSLWNRYKTFNIIAASLPFVGIIIEYVLYEASNVNLSSYWSVLLFILLPFVAIFSKKYSLKLSYPKLLHVLTNLAICFYVPFIILKIISYYLGSDSFIGVIVALLSEIIINVLLIQFIAFFDSLILHLIIAFINTVNKSKN